MKRPTQKQIDKEIKSLTEMKPNVRHFRGFGDDHHTAIDAQIDVLTNHMTDSEIFDRYGAEDTDGPQNVQDAALDARSWLDGNRQGTLSEEWQELVQ